jgi:hypothetical protein
MQRVIDLGSLVVEDVDAAVLMSGRNQLTVG